jgi:biotin carboxyl carrier protein
VKYTVEVAGRKLEIEIEEGRVRVDGREVEAILGGRPGGVVRRLARAGSSRPFQAREADGPGAWRLTCEGQRLDALVLDHRQRAIREAASAGTAPHQGTLRAPMPGRVLRVLVEAGHTVTLGQALIVVEAMKMENELKSPGAGTIGRVHVRVGDTVEKGGLLIELT